MEVLMKGLICLAGCLTLLFCGQVVAGGAYLSGFDVPDDAEYIGSEDCTDCHDDVAEFYTHSPHHWERGLAIPGTDIAGCEACHGPGSLHVEEGGEGWILGYEQLGDLDPEARAAMCTQCHTGQDIHWASSAHAGTEVSCADCHRDQVHHGGLARPAGEYRNQSEFCLQCHTEVVPQFRMPYRHRVLEGQLTCNDCHDPHRGMDVGDWEDLNGTCLSCHTQMAGPFVFEHGGVEGEECLSCHRPHGSQHDKMLIQSGNGLCLQCHYEQAFSADDNWSLGGQAHAGLIMGEARCYDCHREVHGSNTDPAFR
jgi:DmsE family decaheme c-type cytochrome